MKLCGMEGNGKDSYNSQDNNEERYGNGGGGRDVESSLCGRSHECGKDRCSISRVSVLQRKEIRVGNTIKITRGCIGQEGRVAMKGKVLIRYCGKLLR